MIKKDCFFTSIALKDAYYATPINEHSRKYFRFIFKADIYEFNALLMGYSDSPRIFTKVMKPALSVLRSNNINITMYVNDALLVQDDYDTCLKATNTSAKLLDKLGLTIHPHKSSLLPSQKIVYWGFFLDSVSMTFYPTESKAMEIIDICDKVLNTPRISIRFLSSLLEKFVAVEFGNRYAKLFYKCIQILRNKELRKNKNKGDFEAIISLTDEEKADIYRWKENIQKYPVNVVQEPIAYSVTSNASNLGWGGHFQGETTGGL